MRPRTANSLLWRWYAPCSSAPCTFWVKCKTNNVTHHAEFSSAPQRGRSVYRQSFYPQLRRSSATDISPQQVAEALHVKIHIWMADSRSNALQHLLQPMDRRH
jgi:hypothetical protein